MEDNRPSLVNIDDCTAVIADNSSGVISGEDDEP